MARRRPTARDEQRGASAWPAFLKAHAVLLARVEERLKALRLPDLAWYDVLWALECTPENRLRMHELAEHTVITRSNLTRLVDRLEAAGLVLRDRDCTDRRGSYAVLSAAGREMRRRMWRVYAPAIRELFDRHFSGVEHAQLQEMLQRLLQGHAIQRAPATDC
jgi:DNA-binding MarR family transcriptional regulator